MSLARKLTLTNFTKRMCFVSTNYLLPNPNPLPHLTHIIFKIHPLHSPSHIFYTFIPRSSLYHPALYILPLTPTSPRSSLLFPTHRHRVRVASTSRHTAFVHPTENVLFPLHILRAHSHSPHFPYFKPSCMPLQSSFALSLYIGIKFICNLKF